MRALSARLSFVPDDVKMFIIKRNCGPRLQYMISTYLDLPGGIYTSTLILLFIMDIIVWPKQHAAGADKDTEAESIPDKSLDAEGVIIVNDDSGHGSVTYSAQLSAATEVIAQPADIAVVSDNNSVVSDDNSVVSDDDEASAPSTTHPVMLAGDASVGANDVSADSSIHRSIPMFDSSDRADDVSHLDGPVKLAFSSSSNHSLDTASETASSVDDDSSKGHHQEHAKCLGSNSAEVAILTPEEEHDKRLDEWRVSNNGALITEFSNVPLTPGTSPAGQRECWWCGIKTTHPYPYYGWRCQKKRVPAEERSYRRAVHDSIFSKRITVPEARSSLPVKIEMKELPRSILQA